MQRQIIVLGNLLDPNNRTNANARIYSGGGIAPTIGASNFGHEKLIISKKRKDETGNNNRTKERILNNS